MGCSLTVHPAANGYLVVTLGKLKAASNFSLKPGSHGVSQCLSCLAAPKKLFLKLDRHRVDRRCQGYG